MKSNWLTWIGLAAFVLLTVATSAVADGEPGSTRYVYGYRVQIHTSNDIEKAHAYVEAIEPIINEEVYVVSQTGIHRVRVGNFVDKARAQELADQMVEYGFENVFIISSLVPEPRKLTLGRSTDAVETTETEASEDTEPDMIDESPSELEFPAENPVSEEPAAESDPINEPAPVKLIQEPQFELMAELPAETHKDVKTLTAVAPTRDASSAEPVSEPVVLATIPIAEIPIAPEAEPAAAPPAIKKQADLAPPSPVTGTATSPPPEWITTSGFRLQLYATADPEKARGFAEKISSLFGAQIYVEFIDPYYRVRVGDCRDRAEARLLRDIAQKNGYEKTWIAESDIRVPAGSEN